MAALRHGAQLEKHHKLEDCAKARREHPVLAPPKTSSAGEMLLEPNLVHLRELGVLWHDDIALDE